MYVVTNRSVINDKGGARPYINNQKAFFSLRYSVCQYIIILTRTIRPIRSDLNLIPKIKSNLTTCCTLPEYILNSASNCMKIIIFVKTV